MATKEEIDLREQIADAIEQFRQDFIAQHRADGTEFHEDVIWAFGRAQGIVREPILHGRECPCSKCEVKR